MIFELAELALVVAEVAVEVVAELATDAAVSRPRARALPRKDGSGSFGSRLFASPATYVLLGAALGGVSFWLWPDRVAHGLGARVGLVFITTMVGGTVMEMVGRRRARTGQPRGRLATFTTGALFALAYASARALGHWLSR